MNIKPIGNRILVKAVAEEPVTKSGIILPDSGEKKSGLYEIVAVGDGEQISKLGLTVGKKVFAGKYAGDEVEVPDDKDNDYKILYVGTEEDENDVTAFVE